MYYAIASVRKLQMKLNVTNKREEQVLMPRRMDTSQFCHIQHKTQQDGKCLLVVLLKWREQTSWLEC